MTDSDLAAVQEVIDYPHPRMPRNVREAGQAALNRLVVRLREVEERLTEYETPGWITSIQAVVDVRRRAEAAEAREKTLRDEFTLREAALREALEQIDKEYGAPWLASQIARAALDSAQEEI